MKRHPVNVFNLISGGALVAFALAYLIGAAFNTTPLATVTLPLLLVGLGAAGIGAAVVAQRKIDRSSEPSLDSALTQPLD